MRVVQYDRGVQRRISPDEAFAILRDLSQSSNRKLRDVAEAIVDMAHPEQPL